MSEKLEKVKDRPEFISPEPPPKKRGPKTSLNDDEILDLFNQGLDVSKIARKMNVVPGTIKYHLKKMGVMK